MRSRRLSPASMVMLADAIAAAVAGIWKAAGVPVAEKRRLAARVATVPVLAACGFGLPQEALQVPSQQCWRGQRRRLARVKEQAPEVEP